MKGFAALAQHKYLAFLFNVMVIGLSGFWGPLLWLEGMDLILIKPVLMSRAIIIICIGYLLYPGWRYRKPWLFPLLWSLVLALTYLIIVVFADGKGLFLATYTHAAIAVFLLSLALLTSVVAVAKFFPNNGLTSLHGLCVILLLTTLPLWLAPWMEMATSEFELRAVLWSSPLSYLAAMLDYDYLRQRWFYQHLPYSSLRYDYPDTVYFSMGLLVVSCVALMTLQQKLKSSAAQG